MPNFRYDPTWWGRQVPTSIGPWTTLSPADQARAAAAGSAPTLLDIGKTLSDLENGLWGDYGTGASYRQGQADGVGLGQAIGGMDQSVNAVLAVAAAGADSANNASVAAQLAAASPVVANPSGYAQSIAHDVWTYVDGPPDFPESIVMLEQLYNRSYVFQNSYHRLAACPNFLVSFNGAEPPPDDYPWPSLYSACELARLPGETTLAMLNRLESGYDWVENFGAPGIVGAVIPGSHGWGSFNFAYSPFPDLSGLVKAFHDLWNYIPSSGLPYRNGIDDFVTLLTLIPLQW